MQQNPALNISPIIEKDAFIPPPPQNVIPAPDIPVPPPPSNINIPAPGSPTKLPVIPVPAQILPPSQPPLASEEDIYGANAYGATEQYGSQYDESEYFPAPSLDGGDAIDYASLEFVDVQCDASGNALQPHVEKVSAEELQALEDFIASTYDGQPAQQSQQPQQLQQSSQSEQHQDESADANYAPDATYSPDAPYDASSELDSAYQSDAAYQADAAAYQADDSYQADPQMDAYEPTQPASDFIPPPTT